jgi:hypothetical protein
VNYDAIGGTVDRLVQLSRSDWDESETSWDFTSHPLIGGR